jgi:hypothetical protein
MMYIRETHDDIMVQINGTNCVAVVDSSWSAGGSLNVGTRAPISIAASYHGDLRRQEGYSVAMLVEESRLLQVCIFTTLHKNTNRLEFSRLLPDVVTIADEVDAQLKQQMLRYMAAHAIGNKPKVN